MKKRVSKIIIILIFTLIIFPHNTIVVQAKTDNFTYQIDKPILRAEIIGWRYKTEDGKLYKRQYNYSTGKWIGDWTQC